MKRILAFLGTAILLFAGFTSCEDNYYQTGADMETYFITVKPGEWTWNSEFKRYENIRDWGLMDQYMYERGSVAAGVYITETDGNGTYEVLRTLPFVHSYRYWDANLQQYIPYTETFSFDISEHGQITFYIQHSDLSDEVIINQPYEFKVTLFWQNNL